MKIGKITLDEEIKQLSDTPGICEGEKIQLSNIREKADQ